MPFVFSLFSVKIGRVWTLNYLLFTAMFVANLLSEKYQVDQQSKSSTKNSLIIDIIKGITTLKICVICFIEVAVLYFMRNYEFNLRKLSIASIDTSFEKNLSSVLDELPDGIIIANKDALQYMNKEAWKLLKCVNREEGVEHNRGLEDVICLDVGSCAILTPLEQLINFLTNVDKRLKLINKDVFLESMINIATEEAMLLHMHHGL